jgi:membrane protein implicated in regulation of membrane protease activity
MKALIIAVSIIIFGNIVIIGVVSFIGLFPNTSGIIGLVILLILFVLVMKAGVERHLKEMAETKDFEEKLLKYRQKTKE